MRTLGLIFLLVVLNGCTDIKPEAPSFTFGEAVYVNSGFYKGSSGRLTEAPYYVNKEVGYTCEIEAHLVSKDGKYERWYTMRFNCADLIEDQSGGGN